MFCDAWLRLLMWWTKRFICSLPTSTPPWHLLGLTTGATVQLSARRLAYCLTARQRLFLSCCPAAVGTVARIFPSALAPYFICTLLAVCSGNLIFFSLFVNRPTYNSIQFAAFVGRARPRCDLSAPPSVAPYFPPVFNTRCRLPRIIHRLSATSARARSLILLLIEFIRTLWLISFSQVHIMTIVLGRSAHLFFSNSFSVLFLTILFAVAAIFQYFSVLHCYC